MPAAPDLQHQRLRHLFASAILELWKKETGSVTSVLIEGTVCVTVHGGRTTVIQLCDRFAGLVNGDCDRPVDIGTLRHSDGGHLCVAPATAKSRGRASMTTAAQLKDSNNNVRTTPRDAGEADDAATGASVDTDDDDCSLAGDDFVDDGQASMVVDDDEVGGAQSDAVSGQTTSGTGSFSPDTGERGTKLDVVDDCADDSAIYDMSMNRTSNSVLDESPVVAQRPASKTSSSNGCNDLLLSSPHDYTAQVRNVIRQRLLNATGKQSSPSSSSFRGQTSAAAAGMSLTNNIRLPSSPYYRAAMESTPPSLWIKREAPSAAASEAMASAARRLASQYAAAAAGHISMPLMSPPTPLAMSVGLPLPAVPLNASLHNLLGMKSTAMPPAASMLMPGSATPHAPPNTPNSKRGGGILGPTGGGEPLCAGTVGDAGQTSSEQKIYRCDYCNKTFLFKSKYHEHLPVHTSARPFQCHLCTRTYKYKYDLRVHLRTHLGIPTKSTVCPFCAARFATNKFLRQHMREAHSDQNVTPIGPPAALTSNSAVSADTQPTSENVDDEQATDEVTGTALMVDESTDAADATTSRSPAVDPVNSAGQNDATEI